MAEIALRSGLRYCRRLNGSAGSSFAFGIRALPPRKRAALEAVYAFCRVVDDVVDDGVPDAADQLERWRREIGQVYDGTPAHPIGAALQGTLAPFAVPREHFQAIIDGVGMDLERRRCESFEELRGYCLRVASAVGWIAVRIFDGPQPAADTYAEQLGLALQWTNILRDLRSDAARGRTYLPMEALKRFGVQPADLAAARPSENLRRLVLSEAQRARGFYAAADKAFRELKHRRRFLPARIMGEIYRELLTRIEAAHRAPASDGAGGEVRLPWSRQLAIALRCLL
ncbi:MAG: squalene synthase HpnD [Candidatus Omnitrophica bacterium CG11_big_fil_rev_8_21_14_0_20_64_10]|nr:MAG: squalene synthase HpnD [Candidatus Omnitrophica bacterium CG11_big_fil_rev_8_21_14_0_20_64_10]